MFSFLATMKGHVFIVKAMLQYCEHPEQIINSPALYGELTRHESTVLNIAATKYDDPRNREGNIDFTPRHCGIIQRGIPCQGGGEVCFGVWTPPPL